jgi:hypothetical protein
LAIRKRTTKLLAKRHDLDYFKKGSPIRMWQWRLALVCLITAVVWITATSLRSASAFSSGPISSSHAIFGQKCETCHKPIIAGAGFLPVGFGSSRKVPDSACESCHTVGAHHASQTVENKACSTCHIEHVGAMHLASAPISGCTQCHAKLEVRTLPASVATNIDSFTKGHPDFRPLRNISATEHDAAFGLKFNHADHLKEGLTGTGTPGPGLKEVSANKVTLDCAYCHGVEDPKGRDTAHSGRMANVSFERSCQSCHSLDFDKRVKEQVPHAEAAVALKFVQAKMAEVAPGDKPALIRAETILFREKCSLCHTVSNVDQLPGAAGVRLTEISYGTDETNRYVHRINPSGAMPGNISETGDITADTLKIAPSHAPQRFFTAAMFSHSAHSAVECLECHANAKTSVVGTDLLMPGIGVCQRCHDGQSRPQGPALSSGHAESGCSLCHDYHETVALKDGLQPAPKSTFPISQLTSK